jgi:hypothetical protein
MFDIILLFNQNCKGLGFISGDFNCTLGTFDKSSTVPVSNHRASNALRSICDSSGLVDVWRELNSNVRDYNFTQDPIIHILDWTIFLCPLLTCMLSSSDHVPVYIDIEIGNNKKSQKEILERNHKGLYNFPSLSDQEA